MSNFQTINKIQNNNISIFHETSIYVFIITRSISIVGSYNILIQAINYFQMPNISNDRDTKIRRFSQRSKPATINITNTKYYTHNQLANTAMTQK